ncbi:RNA helicase (Hel) [Pseudoloma neurophilia]|uniref:ATP-dependent RNA helicase n=1 Tax=Pseudoloma neurophilia TaxID=146866 RepID=A0A0R0M3A9_9MICR|nr:RNA helicase (Hel) [Pseudoloma neurophilia]
MSSFLKYTQLEKKQMPPKATQKTMFQNKNLRIPFQKPTNIQKDIINHILSSKSACFISSTGSGKSYGYVIGTLLKYNQSSFRDKTTVIVLPTRELVEQIYGLLKEFKKSKSVRILSLSSKYSEERDEKKLRSRPNIIVTTKGRFHLVKSYHMLILDEVDLLLREGFILPEIRPFQLICTSATLSTKYFEQVNLKMITLDDKANKLDLHLFMRREEKASALLEIAQYHKQIIVFCSSKSRVDEVFDFLQSKNVTSCGAIHSDIDSQLRQHNCQKFLAQKINILITTDLASRGLNLNSECIAHYDLSDPDTMIHRRGRCKKNGTIISFYTLFELKYFETYANCKDQTENDNLPTLYSVGTIKSKELNETAENSYNKLKSMFTTEKSTIDTSNLQIHEYFKNSQTLGQSLKNKLHNTINPYKKIKKDTKNTFQDQFFIPYTK